MPEPLTIPTRFNGPPSSANGGYTSGRVAELVGTEEVAVSLRLPPPLERPLDVVRDGDRVELRDRDGELVAEGYPETLGLDVPDPISPDQAAAASEAGHEKWAANHPFRTCVVCGPDRRPHDGLCIFPGPLADGMFAAPWTPDESVGNGDGEVRPECVWAALDCPTSAPVVDFSGGSPCVLARLTARVGDVRAGPHSIVSWPIEVDGRKRHSGAAMFDSDGSLVAAARALWIELRQV